jgi:alpha-beta hydrolase superfamily lysophospholipase
MPYGICILMTYKEGTADLGNGLKVFYRTWMPEKSRGTIIGVHGFVEHTGRYVEFGKYLESNGYTLAMYDLRGHGRTASADEFGYVKSFETLVTDTEAFSSYVMDVMGSESVFLLGHSMGGLIVFHVLARSKVPVRGAVTSGASLGVVSSGGQRAMLSIINAISPRKRVKLPIHAEYLSHDPAIGENYLKDTLVCKNPSVSLIYQLYQGSRNIWKDLGKVSSPVLMLQGSDDKIVPPSVTPQAYESISSTDKTKKMYDGFYHEILNERGKEAVYSDILEWLSAH